MDKDVCATHGTLPEDSIHVMNGVRICVTCGQPLFTQTELESDSPPVWVYDPDSHSWSIQTDSE